MKQAPTLVARSLLVLILLVHNALGAPQAQQTAAAASCSKQTECGNSGNATNLQQLQEVVPRNDVAGSVQTAPAEKTADLTSLINETLVINNKTAPKSEAGPRPTDRRPIFKDDWTFDMVEYDLLEFLQDLSARYKGTTNASKQAAASDSPVEGRKSLVGGPQAGNVVAALSVATTAEVEKILVGHEKTLTADAAVNFSSSSSPELVKLDTSSPAAADQKPLLAQTNDHEIADSTWQYGIFDRFTRPKSTSTTTVAPQSESDINSSNNRIDSRSFNSDECGLRTYDESNQDQTSYGYPQAFEDVEAVKELNQRRQKPPLGSAFFASSHKKFQSGGGSLASELPFDSVAESAEKRGDLAGTQPNYDDAYKPLDSDSAAPSGGEAGTLGDSEFNLSLRRQWLQQQLGNTLQQLGFNTSSPKSALDLLTNGGGGGIDLLSSRENMMKKSAPIGARSLRQETSQKQSPLPAAGSVDITEQELKARQDELKLEARVIGGSDARLGDSPWSASLQALVSRPGTGSLEYRHYCGGTIISEHYILTAAHCLDFMVGRESRLFVVIGDLNWRMSAASVYGRRFGVEKLTIHSGYKSTAFGHDLGLIKTKESMKPLKVNGRYIINSVCLPERNVEHSGEAELVGWGLFSNRNEMADSLQIVDVPILPRPLCVDLYRRRTGLIQWLIGIELITEKQVCAGTFGRGICQGDSGSALVFNEKVTKRETRPDGKSALRRSNLARDQQNKATIIGIVAFGGIRRCSYQSLPGVYMQTSKYMDWILPRIQS